MTERRRNLLILALVAGLVAASALVLVQKKTKLGLDLQGGVELVYQARPSPQQPKVTPEAVDRAVQIMRKRVDKLGVSEPELARTGDNLISVGLPAVRNAARAQQQVGTTAQLYFFDWEPNVVGPNGKPDASNAAVTGGAQAGSAASLTHFDAVILASKRPAVGFKNLSSGGQFYLVDDKAKKVLRGPEELRSDLVGDRSAPPGSRVVYVHQGTLVVQAEQPTNLPKGTPAPDQWFVLNDNFALRGTDIRSPKQDYDPQSNTPVVTFQFTDLGRRIWQQTTARIAKRGSLANIPGQPVDAARQHFAVVLDNQLISVPYIDFNQNPNGIDARTGSQIEGGFTAQSAQKLATLLETGALPVRLKLISQSQVSATLGKEALHQGLIAGLIGLGVVVLFLLTFYRVLGLVASIALAVYGLYFYAIIKLIPITLTLPGIAGLVLTIGVAADANIVIFERVKEEARKGLSVPRAIAAGYKRGLTAIIDANVVTLMTAFILFMLATAGVKGFAFTLGIGTLVSLFTAVLATQAVLGSLGRTRLLARPSALGARSAERTRKRFDFMGASRWFFSLSGLILLIGALALGGKGLKFGIDFESGTRIVAPLVKPADENAVRGVLSSQGYADAKIQRVGGRNEFQVSTRQLQPENVVKVRQALDKRFGGGENYTNSSIGPTFGQAVANSAIIAILVSLLVISAYIALRFEWKYAVPVLIALLHDLLITSGVYSLLGREVTTSTVAALLTILGYSLYDTIIVFDRVRENVPRMPRAAFSQIVNRSMSEVLTRSLATSLCTLLPVVALLLFGGDTLKDFAFALLIGVASGAYSSVFIASPVLTHWKEREPIYRQRRTRIEAEEGGAVPAYADAVGDVEQADGRRRHQRTTLSDDPDLRKVSGDEWRDMVSGVEATLGEETRPPVGAATGPVTRQRRPRANGARPAGEQPDSVQQEPGEKKPKRPRNAKHGRPR